MATTEPENLVDTIRSRSQHFHFRALTFAEITARLEEIAAKENVQIEPGALAVIARMAEGSMRDALSLLEQARAYCGDTIPAKEVRELLGVVPEDALEELVNAIAAGSADRALALVHSFQKEGRNLQHFCREAIRHIRNLLVARVCGADSDLIAATPDQRPALERAAALFTEEDLTRFFQILLQTDEDLRRKLDPRVHLEMGLLRLINAARLAPLEELVAEVRSGAPSPSSSVPMRGAAPSAVSSATPKRELPSALASPSPFTPPPRASAAAAGIASPPQPVPFRPAERAPQSSPSAFAAPKAAPAPVAPRPVAASPAEEIEEVSDGSAKATASGLSAEQVDEIKSTIQSQQKFLGELLEHGHRWELEGAELRIYFPTAARTYAEMVEGRDSLEKIRGIASKVLGRPVRVCAKLESVAAVASPASRGSASQDLRDQFERDPLVKSMMQRFGGKITEVKRNQEES